MRKHMGKVLWFTWFVFGANAYIHSQATPEKIKVLKEAWLTEKTDTSKLQITYLLANGYRFSNIDSSLHYSDLGVRLADRLDLPAMKARFLSLKGATLLESGRLPESLQYQFDALNISEALNDTSAKAFALNRIGNTYMELADYRKANEYYFRSMELFEKIGDQGMVHNEVSNIGNIYELMQFPDSALYYQQIVYRGSLLTDNRNEYTRPEIMFRLGNAYKLNRNNDSALIFYKKGITEANIDNDIRNLTMNTLFISKLYNELGMRDSSLKYAYYTLKAGEIVSFRKGMYESSMLISELFRNENRYDSAYKYLLRANEEKDSLVGTKRFQELQRIILDEQERQREREAQVVADRNRQKQYILIAGLVIFLAIATLLYRNNKQKQKVNQDLEKALFNLEATQSQLIHSEKMASLGELTAGIAHEIQNPLNFVNNFSEINSELVAELKDELQKGNFEEAKGIAGVIDENEQKIIFHGKRADAIVKGMLQHSRSSPGIKEPTDINALAEEYLRLAYHGLRAKDKSFNASMKSDLDPNVGLVKVIPQDMGRVILNLITNAFYAVTEKRKMQLVGYDPTVTISTKRLNGKVEIVVSDNGIGIPGNVRDKIFQPFFTTKPTGKGTGLGLSMSYDIIRKGHGGELKVETTEGEGTRFIIILSTTS
jgi:two-component system NtrC family sensor kinase